jgi:NADP-dependent aldehyde dehydrogenase
VFAEMSSLNPVFLLPGALQTKAAEIAQGLLGSFTMGVGQLCTKPGLIFALRGPDTEQFLGKFTELVRGSPSASMLTPHIHESYLANQRTVLTSAEVRVAASSNAPHRADRAEAQPSFATTTAATFLKNPAIATEVFGPFTVVILAESDEEMIACAQALEGQLTATVHATDADQKRVELLLPLLEAKAGRLVYNAFPTGVEVSAAMNHGGPWPATSDVRFTSVGTAAIFRFARPICYQGFPQTLLPPGLRDR